MRVKSNYNNSVKALFLRSKASRIMSNPREAPTDKEKSEELKEDSSDFMKSENKQSGRKIQEEIGDYVLL